MSDISITVGTTTGTATFTAAQADRLLGPILPSLGWTASVVWSELTGPQKQAAVDLLAGWLRRTAAKEARALTTAAAAATAAGDAQTAYDTAMSGLL